MNGLGNDYLFFDSKNCKKEDFDLLKNNIVKMTQRLSNRNFGVGGDGVVLVEESRVADAKMRIFNADGSEGNMCGNALRCIGKILYDKTNKSQKEFCVETLSGIKHLKILNSNPNESIIATSMGMPILVCVRNGIEYYDIGNNHAIIYVDEFDDMLLTKATELSKERDINVELVKVEKDHLSMRVIERGSGETLSCGTGATCVAFSSFSHGFFKDKANILTKGGLLSAEYQKDGIVLVGNASLNYIGDININYYGKN